jgi:nicotinamidase-related amidase
MSAAHEHPVTVSRRRANRGTATRRALLVIDMLNGFLDPRGALYCGPAARRTIPFVARRIRAYARRGDAVLFSCDRHAPRDPEFRLWAAHCVRGTWEAEIAPGIPVPRGARIIPKTTINPFHRTGLGRALARARPEIVEVVGVCTNICVLYAAMELKVRSYRVRVPRRGVATFDRRWHGLALQAMARTFGVKVV